MIFPQQASNLLTSMRQCTKLLPTPGHSRMALGQVSARQQPLRLLSVCLQDFPRRLSQRTVPKSIQQASTTLLWGDGSSDELPVRGLDTSLPSVRRQGRSFCQSEVKLRTFPAQDKTTFKQVCCPLIMGPSRREGPLGCERSQCKSARIRAEGPIWRRDGPYAVNYYPNTDRMKTTVQHSPQIALKGIPLHSIQTPNGGHHNGIHCPWEST